MTGNLSAAACNPSRRIVRARNTVFRETSR